MPNFHLPLSLPLLLLLLLSGCAGTDKSRITTPEPAQQSGNIQAANEALGLQGYPYLYGGESPQEGFDCSGLVFYVYQRQGIKLPRTAQALAQNLPPVALALRQPGDLLFFHTSKAFSHVGIYVGDDNFVHAPSSRTGRVMVSNLQQAYWRDRFIGVRRPAQSQSLSSTRSREEHAGSIKFNSPQP